MDVAEDNESAPNFCELVWEGTSVTHAFRTFEDKLFKIEVRCTPQILFQSHISESSTMCTYLHSHCTAFVASFVLSFSVLHTLDGVRSLAPRIFRLTNLHSLPHLLLSRSSRLSRFWCSLINAHSLIVSMIHSYSPTLSLSLTLNYSLTSHSCYSPS